MPAHPAHALDIYSVVPTGERAIHVGSHLLNTLTIFSAHCNIKTDNCCHGCLPASRTDSTASTGNVPTGLCLQQHCNASATILGELYTDTKELETAGLQNESLVIIYCWNALWAVSRFLVCIASIVQMTLTWSNNSCLRCSGRAVNPASPPGGAGLIESLGFLPLGGHWQFF